MQHLIEVLRGSNKPSAKQKNHKSDVELEKNGNSKEPKAKQRRIFAFDIIVHLEDVNGYGEDTNTHTHNSTFIWYTADEHHRIITLTEARDQRCQNINGIVPLPLIRLWGQQQQQYT